MKNYELIAMIAMHKGRFGELPDYITMSTKAFNELFHARDTQGSEASAAVKFGSDRIPVVSSLIIQGGDAFSVSNSDFDMSTPWRVVQCRWVCYNFCSCEYGFSDDAGRTFQRPEKPKPP